MLHNYDELCFKAILFPLAISLDDLSDDLAKLDCTDNTLAAENLLKLLERLESINTEAHRRIYELLNSFGYKRLVEKKLGGL